MPTNYTGSQQDLAGRPNLTISEPAGTDVRNSGSVRTPLETLANWVHTLIKKAGLLEIASTWTARQTFDGGCTVPESAPGSSDACRRSEVESLLSQGLDEYTDYIYNEGGIIFVLRRVSSNLVYARVNVGATLDGSGTITAAVPIPVGYRPAVSTYLTGLWHIAGTTTVGPAIVNINPSTGVLTVFTYRTDLSGQAVGTELFGCYPCPP